MNLSDSEICDLYLRGKKIIEISKIIKARQAFVSDVLKRNNVRIRTSKDVDFLKYKLNHNYFSKIDSKEKAYLLGIMFSDGSVASKNNTICLTSCDMDLLKFFQTELQCEKQIRQNSKNKKAFCLSFCSPKIKSELIALGCVPKKSLILKYPKINQFEKYFILGLFDGDGSIIRTDKTSQVYFLGTKDICRGIKKYLSKFGIIFNKIQKEGKIFRLRVTNESGIQKIKHIFYATPPAFFLKRKESKF